VTAVQAIIVALLVSLLPAIIGIACARELLQLMGADAWAIEHGYRYTQWMLGGNAVIMLLFVVNAIFRGAGDAAIAMRVLWVANGLNILLDPLLIFGWLGLPRLGLVGTAWATLIAQGLGLVGLLAFVAWRRPLAAPDWRRLRIDAKTAWLLLRIGFPSMVQQSVVSVSMLGIVRAVSQFGIVADAAFGVGLRIDSVAFMPAISMGLAAATLAGQNIGARCFSRVRQTFGWGLLMSAGISAVIMLAAILFPLSLQRPFVNEPEVLRIGAGYLRIVSLTYVLYAVMFVSNGIINGAGHTIITTLISITALWGIRLPLAGYLASRMQDVTGVWIAMVSSVAVGMVLSLAYYFSRRWQRPITNTPRAQIGPVT